ncbi:MAG: putative membrane protein [Bacteroidia bacterium]|jgi:putative membrane protein
MIRSLLIFLKGMAMGAADVVPGVSGGTIAFITGIYDDLLSAINAINLKTLKQLKTEGVKAVWKTINGNFLLALFLGIAVSFLSLSKVFKYLLDTHPNMVWAFFFGLVLGSIFLVSRMIGKWNVSTVIATLVGTAISYYLTIIQPGGEANTMWFIFLSGAIAICAMILPGVSGSFILLILGVYYPMLEAVSTLDLKFIAVLGAGAIIGLLSFSRFLKWLLDAHYQVTVAVLLGFLIGSLNKLWPWKHTISTRLNSHYLEVPFIQENVMPSAVENPQILAAICFMVVGVAVIVLMSKFAPKKQND